MVSPMKAPQGRGRTLGLEQCRGGAALGAQDSLHSDQEILLSFEVQRG